MTDYYENNSLEYFEATFNIDPSSFLNPLVERLEPGSTILDIGCGSGRDLLWLKNKGLNPTGLEKSTTLARLARENSCCPVITADFLAYDFSQEGFDGLLLVGSFVHLERDQLAPMLKSICMGLKYQGLMFLTLKEGQGVQNSKDGRIFTLWEQQHLEKIFSEQGLKVLNFSRQVSKIRNSDIWLGYLLQINRTNG